MNEAIHSAAQTDAPADAVATATEADVLRAADAWHVEGFSVWDAVKVHIAAEMPQTSPFRADALRHTIYETHANDEPAESSARLAALMAQLEATDPDAVAKARWEAERMPIIDVTRHKPEASAIVAVPAEIARAHRVVPIRKVANKLWVAMENPLDVQAVDAVRMASRCQVIPLAAVPDRAISYALNFAYPQAGATQAQFAPPENRASENATAELVALVRDLQNEVRELKQEVQGLKKQVAAQQLAPPPLDARPAAYPTPRVFRATPAVQHPPFPLFRD